MRRFFPIGLVVSVGLSGASGSGLSQAPDPDKPSVADTAKNGIPFSNLRVGNNWEYEIAVFHASYPTPAFNTAIRKKVTLIREEDRGDSIRYHFAIQDSILRDSSHSNAPSGDGSQEPCCRSFTRWGTYPCDTGGYADSMQVEKASGLPDPGMGIAASMKFIPRFTINTDSLIKVPVAYSAGDTLQVKVGKNVTHNEKPAVLATIDITDFPPYYSYSVAYLQGAGLNGIHDYQGTEFESSVVNLVLRVFNGAPVTLLDSLNPH